MRADEPASYICFVRRKDDDRHWKLCCTKDPESALRRLQMPSPAKLVLGPSTPGDIKLKNQLGFHLNRHRPDKHAKDWFDLTRDEINEVFLRLQTEGPSFLATVKRIEEARRKEIKSAARSRLFGNRS